MKTKPAKLSHKFKVELEFDTEQSSLSAGFRVNWASGEDRNHAVELTSGAGVGSPFMVFTITDKKTGKDYSAIADVRPLINSLSTIMEARIKPKAALNKAEKGME